MSLLALILVIVIAGVLLWLINAYVPMQPQIKTLLNVAVVIILIIWILKAMGIFEYLGNVKL